MKQPRSSHRTHAECVALSRQNGHDRERLATEAAAAGDHEAAAEHRRVAKLYRDEADFQDGTGPAVTWSQRRPGVRNAADKARFNGEPTVAQMRAREAKS